MPRRWVLKRGFDRVFAARRNVGGRVLAVRWTDADRAETHIGISVARRAGNAVQRNRAKRRLRAIVRCLHQRLRGGFDVVIVARQGVADASYEELARSLQELFSRAGILNGEEATGHEERDRSPRADSGD